jgi:hypothetical protein
MELYARGAVGVNVATVPEQVTAPATAVPPGPVTVKDAEPIVARLIASLNVAPIVVLIETFVAPLAGNVDTTVGTVTTSWPHPAMRAINRAAGKHVMPTPNLRICTLSSN